jgi:hypothetical protein
VNERLSFLQQRTDILNSMSSRVDEITSITKQLPPSKPAQLAIQAGTQEVVAAATTAITTNSANNVLNKFSMKRDS